MIDRLPLEAQIARQFGAVLRGGRYMVGECDVTEGVNWTYELIRREQERLLEPLVEVWEVDYLPPTRDNKRRLLREWPTLAHRLNKVTNIYKELKHG